MKTSRPPTASSVTWKYRTKLTRKPFPRAVVERYLLHCGLSTRSRTAIRHAMIDGCTYAEAGRRVGGMKKQYVYRLVKKATHTIEQERQQQ